MSEPALLAQHATLLERFAISAAVRQARGYRSVTDRGELAGVKFNTEQCRVPALLIPIKDAAKQSVLHQLRPDRPRHLKGMPLEYEVPKGSHLVIDVPAGDYAELTGLGCVVVHHRQRAQG